MAASLIIGWNNNIFYQLYYEIIILVSLVAIDFSYYEYCIKTELYFYSWLLIFLFDHIKSSWFLTNLVALNK